MAATYPSSTAGSARHSIYAMLVSFPIASFTLTLLTDIAYWRTSHLMWQHFSEWLLFAGLVFGGLAALAWVVSFLARRGVRAEGPAWPSAVCNVVVLILAFINSLVHAGDGWTAVVPWGLVLSAVTVVLMLISSWLSPSVVYRHGVGVRGVGATRYD